MKPNKFYFKNLIDNESPIILDIGCYDGKDSREFNDIFKEPIIFCFESDVRSQELFINTNKCYKNLTLYKHAIGNVDGEITFYISHDDDTTEKPYYPCSSSIKEPKNHLKWWKSIYFKNITVPCKKLDTWYNEVLKDKIIDFIWADVNGGEEDLVLGGLNTIKNKTRYLFTEYSNDELFDEQINLKQILDYLPDFHIKVQYPTKYYGNVLLENKLLL